MSEKGALRCLEKMTGSPIWQVNPNNQPETAVTALLHVAEDREIVRWIEFPNSVLLFVIVSGILQSGAIYFLGRKRGRCYAVDRVPWSGAERSAWSLEMGRVPEARV